MMKIWSLDLMKEFFLEKAKKTQNPPEIPHPLGL